MSVPIVFAIVLDVQAAIQAIATGAGYNYDVKATSVVIDPKDLTAVPSTETPFTVVGDPEVGSRDFAGSRPNAIKDRFTIRLMTRVEAPGTDRARKTLAAWLWAADVETKLSRDPQRGGRALYTYVQQPIVYYSLMPSATAIVIEIPVEILMQRAYGSPMEN